MPAIITDVYKQKLISQTYDDFINLNVDSADSDASRYYIGIGRTQPWAPPDSDTAPPSPDPSRKSSMEYRENLQTLMRVKDASHVVSRYNWTNGGIYSGWNNKFHSNNLFIAGGQFEHPFYVMTGNNAVYVCIKQGKDANGLEANSVIQPSDASGEVFETSDNYQWKFLYTVSTAATQKFLTSGYLPTEKIIDSADGGPPYDDLDPFEKEQLLIQKEAVPGQIVGVEIENGGNAYPDGVYELSFDGVPLTINGAVQTITPAYAWAKCVGGSIVDVTMKDPNQLDTFWFGENYYDATVKFTAGDPGSNSVLRAIPSQPYGLAADVRHDFNSTALMFHVLLDGNEDGNAIVDNDFRQVGLIRNPQVEDSDGSGNAIVKTLNTNSTLALDAINFNLNDVGVTLFLENLKGDNVITGQTSGAQAILNSVVDDLFYYTQVQSTGYLDFVVGEPIDISDGGGSTSVVGLAPTGVLKTTGDIYYIDSRRPFMRSEEQIEDIKIIIDF